MKKERADKLIHERGMSRSREEAKRLIMAGLTHLENRKINKPGELISLDSEIFIKNKLHPYVGRGGLKLEKALKEFNIKVENRICADIGSSTGGFTDCLLQQGARKVFAIDSGTNQLDFKLRSDPRVVVMENVNARYLSPQQLNDHVSFICMDVSFISVKKIIPIFKNILIESDFDCAILIKPQFEVGKEEVEKKGIIKDKSKHLRILKEIIEFCKKEGLACTGVIQSPVKGQKGNTEYLIHLKDPQHNGRIPDVLHHIEKVVLNAEI